MAFFGLLVPFVLVSRLLSCLFFVLVGKPMRMLTTCTTPPPSNKAPPAISGCLAWDRFHNSPVQVIVQHHLGLAVVKAANKLTTKKAKAEPRRLGRSGGEGMKRRRLLRSSAQGRCAAATRRSGTRLLRQWPQSRCPCVGRCGLVGCTRGTGWQSECPAASSSGELGLVVRAALSLSISPLFSFSFCLPRVGRVKVG